MRAGRLNDAQNEVNHQMKSSKRMGSNTGKKIGDKGQKAKGNKRTRQVADRYK